MEVHGCVPDGVIPIVALLLSPNLGFEGFWRVPLRHQSGFFQRVGEKPTPKSSNLIAPTLASPTQSSKPTAATGLGLFSCLLLSPLPKRLQRLFAVPGLPKHKLRV